MAVTWKDTAKDGGAVATKDRDKQSFYAPDGRELTLEQFETFGQLKCSHRLIAAYYGLSPGQISVIMNRADYKLAYNKGRAEAAIAYRHKQFSMGLAGDARMLMGDIAQFYGDTDEAMHDDDVQTSRSNRAWGVAVLDKAKKTRIALTATIEDVEPE